MSFDNGAMTGEAHPNDPGALADWMPDAPLATQEWALLEVCRNNGLDLTNLQIRDQHEQLYIADFGDQAAALVQSFLYIGTEANEAAAWETARGAFGLALRARLSMHGPSSEQVLAIALQLATTFYNQEDWTRARVLEEHVADRRRRLLGPEHANTLRAENSLSTTLFAQGDLQGARALQEHIVAASGRLFGLEHSNTLVAENNLTTTLIAQGDLQVARVLQEQVVEVSRRLLGADHSDTLKYESNLALILAAQGVLVGARALQERIVATSRRSFSSDHRSILKYESDLALTLSAQGNLQDARALQEHVVEECRRLPGPEQWATLEAENNLAATLRAQGDLQGAGALQEHIVAAGRRLFASDHPVTLKHENNLAVTLSAQGNLQGARTLQEHVVAASRRSFGPEHLDTLKYESNLALTLSAQGDLRGARALLENTVAASRRGSDRHHSEALKFEGNLAKILHAQGDLSGCRRLQEHIVKVYRESFGPEHPDTLLAEGSLATMLSAQGDLRGARSLLERVVEARSRLVGREHPDTLQFSVNLAEILYAQGDLAGARALQEQVLATSRSVLGREHPLTLHTESDLTLTQFKQGDLPGARVALENLLTVIRRVLGAEHPDTLGAENNLAMILREDGDLAGAQKLQERVFSVSRLLLGPEHPDTLTVADNLAQTLVDQGELLQGRALQEQLLEARRRVLGPEHPDTLGTQSNFALVLGSQADHAAARVLQEQVANVFRRVLGQEHHDTLTAESNLALTLYIQGDLPNARALQEHVVGVIRRVLGREHPRTLIAEHNLGYTLLLQGDTTALRELAFEALARMPNVASVSDAEFGRFAWWLNQLGTQKEANAASEPDTESAAEDWVLRTIELAAPLSAVLRDALELRASDGRRIAMQHYFSFHQSWMRLCTGRHLERLPDALAPLHGIESWSTALSRLLGADPATLNPAQSTLLRLRERLDGLRMSRTTTHTLIDSAQRLLTHLEARLHQVSADNTDAGLIHQADLAASIENVRGGLHAHRSNLEKLHEEEVATLAHYREARDSVAKSDANFVALLRLPSIRTTALASCLEAGSALLLTVALNDTTVLGFVVHARGCALVSLQGFEQVAKSNRSYATSLRAGHRGGILRDSLPEQPVAEDATVSETQPITLETLTEVVRREFWTPLLSALQGVELLHLITGPGQHSLPLECSAPEGLQLRRYCGLPAYLSLRDRPRSLPAVQGTDIVVDAAWNTSSPIPFTEVEAQLVADLLSPVGVVRHIHGRELIGNRQPAPRLLLGMHGGISGEQEDAHGYLLLDPAAEPPLRLDPSGVSALPGNLSEVFASACLGAVVGTSDSGAAIGIASELQLRGVTAIIGCLMPVADFYMPLLVALYCTQRLDGANPYKALQHAKRRLLHGDWPQAMTTRLRPTYAATMREVLQRALHRTNDSQSRRLAQSVGGWLLPSSARRYFLDADNLNDDWHRLFSAAYCDTETSRERLINQCLSLLIDERALHRDTNPSDPVEFALAHRALLNICTFTQCFGNAPSHRSTPSRSNDMLSRNTR